jgi:DinB superfamily
MDERIRSITSDLSKVAGDAKELFGGLSAEQLNWKPAEKSWSVGQCFKHIIRTNELFFPEFESIAAGTRQNSFWENWSPLTGWFGRLFIKSVSDDKKKIKAPSEEIVPPSEIEPNVIERFDRHIADVNKKVEACAAADRQKTVLTFPFKGRVFTYTLDDVYTAVVEHTRRHFRQANRVTGAKGFPY